MNIRVQPNYNKRTDEDLFGLSFRLDGGRLYCKYPIGHQAYKSISEAYEARKKVAEQIRNGARLRYGPKGSAGLNKAEYVEIIED